MSLRFRLLLHAMLIGALARAQEETPDVRLVPDIDGVVIDVPAKEEVPTPDSTGTYMLVEEMPEFPGGMPGLSAYVSGNLRYPKEARKRNIEGLVLLAFIVEKNGSVSDVRVLRGIGGDCDEEALRVVREMPTWKPGHQAGKPVRTRYTLPLRFKLVD